MATGVIETSNNGLFDNEIEFNGKYATMVRFLKDDVCIFTTFREAYLACALIGCLNKAKGTKDDEEKVQPASIFPSDLTKKKSDLKLAYRIIMLVDDIPNGIIEDYMNRAFRDDSDDNNRDNLRANMKLFNSYVCGGLEILYNKFKDLDKKDEIINMLYEFVHSFSIDIGLIKDDEILADFEIDSD